MRKLAILVGVLLLGLPVLQGASVDKASLLRRHGLLMQAKAELIDVIFSAAPDPMKARAYYELGSIAFEEKDVSAALETWSQLADKFPASEQAGLVKDRIKELSEIVGEVSRKSVDNAVAQTYLRNADFWSEGKDEIFHIDSSWIPNEQAAVKWYDKVIAEYPKSVASRVAYEGKLRALLGWRETGQYAESHGVRGNFSLFMPQVLSTFDAFQTEHPDAPSLQAFRYQIAQAYWSHKDWTKTREWLNTMIQKSGDKDGFYKDLAERRLAKVEF